MTQTARTPSQIGDLLSRQRRLLKLTQADVGDRAGLRQATVSKIEAGASSVRLETLCSILAALDLELSISPRHKSSDTNIEDIF